MLSRKTKYGIKALTYLALNQDKQPVPISDIADSETISRKFLESILLELRKTGILGSKKGKGGGYYLRESPDQIIIAKVYRILEGPIALVPCVSLNFYERCEDCPDEAACAVHHLMIRVRDNTLNVLEHTTLSDLMKH